MLYDIKVYDKNYTEKETIHAVTDAQLKEICQMLERNKIYFRIKPVTK